MGKARVKRVVTGAKRKDDPRVDKDVLRRRLSFLQGEDRVLMKKYLNGATFYRLAKVEGVHETTIARRIRKFERFLMACKYGKCLDNQRKFTPEEMKVAKLYFTARGAIRKAAAKLHFTYYHMRSVVKRINAKLAEIDKKNRQGKSWQAKKRQVKRQTKQKAKVSRVKRGKQKSKVARGRRGKR